MKKMIAGLFAGLILATGAQVLADGWEVGCSVRTRRTAMAAMQVTATMATAYRHHAVHAQIRDAAAVAVDADIE